MTRVITCIQLTKELHVPAVKGFPLKKTLSSTHYPEMTFKSHSGGVVGEFKGVIFLIPYSQIECIVMEDRENVKEASE